MKSKEGNERSWWYAHVYTCRGGEQERERENTTEPFLKNAKVTHSWSEPSKPNNQQEASRRLWGHPVVQIHEPNGSSLSHHLPSSYKSPTYEQQALLCLNSNTIRTTLTRGFRVSKAPHTAWLAWGRGMAMWFYSQFRNAQTCLGSPVPFPRSHSTSNKPMFPIKGNMSPSAWNPYTWEGGGNAAWLSVLPMVFRNSR